MRKKNQIFLIESESKQEKGILFNTIFWNINGMPLENDLSQKGIQKKDALRHYTKTQMRIISQLLTVKEGRWSNPSNKLLVSHPNTNQTQQQQNSNNQNESCPLLHHNNKYSDEAYCFKTKRITKHNGQNNQPNCKRRRLSRDNYTRRLQY